MALAMDAARPASPLGEPVEPVRPDVATAQAVPLVLVPTGAGLPAAAASLRRGPEQILARLDALDADTGATAQWALYRPAVDVDAGVLDTAAQVAATVARLVERGQVPLVVGGDHTAALGSVVGVRRGLAARARRDVPLYVLWLDAHPDLNTRETSASGNSLGMVLAGLLGRGPLAVAGSAVVIPERVVLAGVRDADPGEQAFLAAHPEMVRWEASLLQGSEWQQSLELLLDRVARSGGRLYVTLDLDVLDPTAAPGVAIPAAGGAQPGAVLNLLGRVAASGLLAGADVVELYPPADHAGQTARLAAAAVQTLAGAAPRDRAASTTPDRRRPPP
jgi:arginase